MNFFDLFINPIVISILLVLVIYLVFYFTIKKGLLPIEIQHREEKQRLEKEKDEFRSLFSDLDPNPVLQIDENAYILLSNERAQQVLGVPDKKGVVLYDLLPEIPRFEIENYIKENKNEVLELSIFNEYYLVYFRGLERLNLVQIHFNNINALKRNELKVKELTEHMNFLQEHERERISRELHDGLSQSLTSSKMLTEKLRNTKNLEVHESLCDELTKELDLTIVTLRDIALNLRPKMLNEFGLDATVRALIKRVTLASGMHGEYQSSNLENRLDWKLESTIYRMAQELLNNIVKHSHAQNFSLQISRMNGEVILLVSDDGIGFDYIKHEENSSLKGFGLFNLKEQVTFFNGRIEVISAPGEGTEVIIELKVKS